MNTITTTKGDGVTFKTLDRHPKVEAYDCYGMEAGRVMVVLVPGFAWYDAAENIGDDPEGRSACHTRGCDSVSEAINEMRYVQPCKCGRCVPIQHEVVTEPQPMQRTVEFEASGHATLPAHLAEYAMEAEEEVAQALFHMGYQHITAIRWMHRHNLPNALPKVVANTCGMTVWRREGGAFGPQPVNIWG